MKVSNRRPGSAVLIIAGGRGTRFWPESRVDRPKPLFAIDGRSSLLAETIKRMRPLIARERIFVLASADQARHFRPIIRGVLPARNLIVEPEGRGTAIAIAFGMAVIARRRGDDTVVGVMPADHFVAPASGFQRTLDRAMRLAAKRAAIVVIGIKPTRAETGYGYQQVGGKVDGGFRLERFVEKPSPAAARRMVQSGKFLWNAGMFVMSPATLIAELAKHAPSLAEAMGRLAGMRGAKLARFYGTLEFDSFDRVVAEKSRNVLGVRARFRWHDVGSWEGLWEAMRGRGSVVLSGNAIAVGAEHAMARAGDRLMVLLGVRDIIAVDAGDAILIARKSQSQDVRRVIDELKRRGLDRYI